MGYRREIGTPMCAGLALVPPLRRAELADAEHAIYACVTSPSTG